MKFLITPYVYLNKYNKICFSINKEWADLFSKLNVQLFMITYDESLKIKNNDILGYDGIILSGGGEINRHKKNKVNILRDNFEKKLLNISIKNKIPVLAVCRGYQLVADKFGFKQKKINHHKNTNHNIFSVNKKKTINVNSYHTYGILKLNSDFKKIFTHKDDTIEICESKSKRIFCFMFHPERYSKNQIYIKKMIKEFFKIK
tara:strand:+ start:1089 stop:1697 length:609 start_codon:yes stop_codon:yes gene_type:complete